MSRSATEDGTYPTTCWECSTCCGALATVREGRVVDFAPNPEHPYSKGAFCVKGRRDMQPIALDIHTHQVPVDQEALATIDGVAWSAAEATLLVDGQEVGMKPLFAPEALIAWLDANAIAAAFISAPPPLYRQHLDAGEAERWVGYVNRGLAAITERHAERLMALPHLPIEHPELAAEIAARQIAAGVRRFSAPSGGLQFVPRRRPSGR